MSCVRELRGLWRAKLFRGRPAALGKAGAATIIDGESVMIANVGKLDRAIRLILGLTLLALGLGLVKFIQLEGGWATGSAIVGLVLTVTAVISFCPAYTLLGFNTCSK